MTFKDYIQSLNDFLLEHPESADLPAIYAKDDEGNGFNPICFSPSLGEYNGEDFNQESQDFNSVCVN